MKSNLFSQNTVLWADDDLDDLFIMRAILERAELDHHIVEAYNGQDIMRYLDALKSKADFPCLIILDMNMPVLDGRQTIHNIREIEKYNSIPIVVFTTSRSEKDKLFCQSYGVEMFTKPSELEQLERVVVHMLGLCNTVPQPAIKKAF